MGFLSKKSLQFERWVIKMYDKVGCPEEVVELELATRIAVHDLDVMGEISPDNLRNLARASKLLQEAYGKES